MRSHDETDEFDGLGRDVCCLRESTRSDAENRGYVDDAGAGPHYPAARLGHPVSAVEINV